MAKKQAKGMSDAEKIGIGVGLTAAAAAAAGAYFLYGSKNASSNRKKVRSWTLKAKAEVLEKLENAKDITEDEYNELIESVGGVYGSLKSVSKGEITDFKKEMRDQWKNIQKSGAVKKIVRKAVAGAARSAAKETGKQITKVASKKKTKRTAKKATKKASK